jgi:hypothetical protein
MNEKKINRRDFLKSATAAAAGLALPTIIPASALGRGGAIAPSNRITVAHIGVGGMGSGDLQNFVRFDAVQSVAVCDCFKSRREKWTSFINEAYAQKTAKGAYKGCAAYSDFREVMARDDIDAVVVVTPDHWHVPIALAAARAGKDMYVEKPLGLSVAQDIRLREAIGRYKNVFQHGTWQRSVANFRRACELVRNGRIGKIHTVHAWSYGSATGGSTTPIPVPADLDYEMWLGPAPMRPYTVDRCTSNGTYHVSDNCLGFIAGWGIHSMDIAQWGLGMDHTSPVSYEGTGVFPTEGLFDAATSWDVHCKYANGIEMRFMSQDVARPVMKQYRDYSDHGTTFIGADGWISVDRGGLYASNPALLKSVIGPSEVKIYESNDHVRNFLDCVRTREATICPIEVAVRGDTACQLSDIAIRTGRTIRWDPEQEVIVGDEESSRMLARPMRSPWRLEC